jgi:uncharacterized iron-regulated protein
MKNSTAVLTLQKRYQRLQEELAQVGLIALGTITPRLIIKSDPEDKTKRKTYGPYYQWTYKQQGKTVTVNLTRSQTREFQKAINNQRKLERIVAKMLALSKTILQSTTEGVAKRMRSARTQTP